MPGACSPSGCFFQVRDESSTQTLNMGTGGSCGCSCRAVQSGAAGSPTITVNVAPEHSPIPADYDYVMYVTSEPPPSATDASSVLAYALACQYAGTGLPGRNRPVVGVVNFNPSCFIQYSGSNGVAGTQCITDNTYWSHMLNTAVHEIIHALGFSSDGFSRWSDASTGALIPTAQREKQISSFNASTPRTVLTTPRVMREVRAQFACDELPGGMLENQGSSGSRGSHWEKRVMGNELMTVGPLYPPFTPISIHLPPSRLHFNAVSTLFQRGITLL